MAGLFGDLNIDPLTLGLFGMAAGFGSAPRGIGPTLGGGFGGLAQGLSLGQQMQMRQAEMDYKRTQEARAQQELEMKQRQQEQQENFWRNFPGANASPTGLPVAPSGVAPSGGFVDRMVGLESGGDPNAKNPLSSATGAGQFINSTWLDLMRRRKPELASARNDEFLLSLRADPALSREMVAAYAEENGAKLAAAGLPDNDTTRALAHRFGPQGAIQVLSAPPETPIASVVGDQVMKANPDLAGKTAGSVVGWYAQRMGGAPQQSAQAMPDPWEAGQRRMAQAAYAAQAQSRGLIKPGMAEQLRAEAEQLMQRGRMEVTQWQGRWVKRDRITGDITPISPEELERVRGAGGVEQLVPRGQAANRVSYPAAPAGYRLVTDAAGNVVDQVPYASGPAGSEIQKIYNPVTRQEEFYRVPRVPAGVSPQAPAAAPPALSDARVNLQAPGAPAPAWMPSGSVLAPAARPAASVPPGAVPIGPAGPPNNNPGVEGGTKKDIEAALLESQNAIAGMNRVREQFRPEFLQTGTRLNAYWSATKDKLPGIFGSLDQASKAQLEDFTRFRSAAWQDLNQIIKDQSGAAVTVPEMERMLRARPNPGTGVFDGDSPTEFKAKMDEVLELKQRAVLRNAWALRRGANNPLETGVTLDQVPKIMAEEINKAQREIAAQNPDMTPTAVLAAARRKVGMELGLGGLR